MGGSAAGNFGYTSGTTDFSLDWFSDLLTILSFVPFVDTVVDLAALAVDLERGDYESALLDAVGVIPMIGEIADITKTAKLVDKAADVAKIANKTSDFVKFPKKIHLGKQGKHIIGHNNYTKGKSILSIPVNEAQKLITKYSGSGKKIGANRERVNFKKVIGKYVDPKTGKSYDTTIGTIHYSQSGTHIVPDKPIDWRK